MLNILILLMLVFTSYSAAMDNSTQTGVFVSAYFSEADSTDKTIKINFLTNNTCKIRVTYGDEIEDDLVYRYARKFKWVMLKNMTTGKWLKFEYLKLDDDTFKLKVFESDSTKRWRVFHRQKIPKLNG